MSNRNRRLVDMPDDGTGETQALDHHQANLVIRGFKRLYVHKFERANRVPMKIKTDISIDYLRSKRDIHTRLHSIILPQLDQEFQAISQVLYNLDEFRKEPGSKLQLILDMQPEISRTLDQLVCAIDELIPGNTPAPSQTNDQHFQEFKGYRMYRLDEAIRQRLRLDVLKYFNYSKHIIQELVLPARGYPYSIYDISADLNRSIDQAITWLKGSELQIISHLWEEGLIDGSRRFAPFDEYFSLFHPPQESNLLSPTPEITISKLATPLGKSMIPILKLTKLFFDKLASKGMKDEQAPLFTEMSSDQLNFLHDSAEDVGEFVSNLMDILGDADMDSPDDISSRLVDEIEKLSKLFQAYVPLAAFYLTPLFPDIDGVSSQTYFRSWFTTWNTLFFTATHNAIQAAHAFEEEN
ncbi:hypothetical protein PTTG_11822 [Puccinia triticina 1-1 BBBD Race 1]|uniref:Uncharacterized protein n=2 Tax=Puccinia triticina TaxID=208348 RepID=A0A180GB96_PUCT1|nr:uncharacterized protein PtA15_14A409 [Puccinia triticina]OAV89930.1 hypothetical protein PTTG_11822 [Puccinia triticina 1-1 BBBD Race 1]WAQ91525.1 hypothetical protein PtA15_14A409 [Puccinia triticina]